MAVTKTNLYGRQVIYSSVDEITRENILDVLSKAVSIHDNNSQDIEYLRKYYKGDQPINTRQKTYNTDVNNIIVENRAKEIVEFKTGYLIGEPIQYIGKGDSDNESVKELNKMMLSEDQDYINHEIIENQCICGTAYKLCLPDALFKVDGVEDYVSDEVPFEAYSLEPEQTFVIYSSGIGHRQLAGVYSITDDDNNKHYTVYTPKEVFKLQGTSQIESTESNPLGMIPIIEYPANEARIGAFEPVITLLNAINTIDSNRVDGIEQFIQALLVLTNCDLEDGVNAETIKEKGILNLKATGDFEQKAQILASELNQGQTQTLKDDLYQSVLTICAMPNRRGGYSSGETGIAVIYRDGWGAAESAAKNQEMMFKRSERAFLKVAIKIAGTLLGTDFTFDDIDIKFTRRNYENIESKSQVLTSMLNNDKIDPKLAFIYSNMFADSEEAYRMSLPYINRAMNESSSNPAVTNTAREDGEETQTNA